MQNYYHITEQVLQTDGASFQLVLDSTCAVYAGHFPGNPIAPGACSVEMIRQCATVAMHRPVRFLSLRTCKFTRLLRPGDRLVLQLTWTDNRLSATLRRGDEVAVSLKTLME